MFHSPPWNECRHTNVGKCKCQPMLNIVLISLPDKRSNDQSSNTATHCYTLQHTATHCNTLQHTATPSPPLQVNIKRRGHPALLTSMVAVLLSLVREGEQLMPFLKTIANSKSFFGAASRAFRLNPSGNMHNQIMKLPDLQVIEALSMVLERLSRLSSKSSYTMFIRGTQKCGGWWRAANSNLTSFFCSLFFLLLSLLSFALSSSLPLLSQPV